MRINLSEQTDISDLMGSDLPVQDEGASGMSFQWCDGVLLTAIKEGMWVLLDELNLASQSVLEGLNSCLDYRASIFIPELGKTFKCPPTFRIFAAQNPLAQGGGRKGLPKSFLNRFTKVYVDSLSDSDLREIVAGRYPSLDISLITRLVDFNTRVHHDVVEKHEFGDLGSPWEFNLRDVFRWCELIISNDCFSHTFARDIYWQRFRKSEDREKLGTIYAEYFSAQIKTPDPPKFSVNEATFQVGDTILPRRIDGSAVFSRLHVDSGFFLSLLQPMEAVARCIKMKWPCLLVGTAGSGKTSVIASLAELCNAKLVEQCLTSSTDVTELIGCFEQVDKAADDRETFQQLCDASSMYILHRGVMDDHSRQIWELSLSLSKEIERKVEYSLSSCAPGSSLFDTASKLSCILQSKLKVDPYFRDICQEMVDRCSERLLMTETRMISDVRDDNTGQFVWKDGLLVKAMTEGFWLHLENVNFCSSSVLDRLNSVMEMEGELLLSECGTQSRGSEGSPHRVIKRHPDFRIFFSMDPSHGEISRAMRNRCAEISLLQTIDWSSRNENKFDASNPFKAIADDVLVDWMNAFWRGGTRSCELTFAILQTHLDQLRESVLGGGEPPCQRNLLNSSKLLSSLLSQGQLGDSMLSRFLRLFLEVNSEKSMGYVRGRIFTSIGGSEFTPLPTCPDIESNWASNTSMARIEWEARTLRLFVGKYSNVLKSLVFSGPRVFDIPLNSLARTRHSAMVENSRLVDDYRVLLYHLGGVFLSKVRSEDIHLRSAYFASMKNSCSKYLCVMASKWNKIVKEWLNFRQSKSSGDESSAGALWGPGEVCDQYTARWILIGRIIQEFTERNWIIGLKKKLTSQSEQTPMSVLEASFKICEGLMDRSSVGCLVTPALFPFLQSLDEFISHVLRDFAGRSIYVEKFIWRAFAEFLSHRDNLWRSMKDCYLLGKHRPSLGFDDAEFVVQWKWLKKSLDKFFLASKFHLLEPSNSKKRRLDLFIESIDTTVFGAAGTLNASSNKVRKKMGKPLVPHQAKHWNAIFDLRKLSRDVTLVSDQRFEPLFSPSCESLELEELVDSHHPILFVSAGDRKDFLAALCTAHWLSTDEMEGTARAYPQQFLSLEACTMLRQSLDHKRQAFIAELAAGKLDLGIKTVENQLGIDALDELRFESTTKTSAADAIRSSHASLLSNFGKLQISAIAEFWCVHEECRFIGELQRSFMESNDDENLSELVCNLLPSLKRYIDVVTSRTVWDVTDIRPYKTLVWAIESVHLSGGSLKPLVRCLLPTMSCNLFRHVWSNSFINLDCISMQIELPPLWLDNSEAFDGFNKRTILQGDAKEVVCGPTRLRHQVRSEFMLRLLGQQFLAWTKFPRTKYCTMENREARYLQSKEIIDMLSSLSVTPSSLGKYSIQYLLVDTIGAPEASFHRLRVHTGSLCQFHKPSIS